MQLHRDVVAEQQDAGRQNDRRSDDLHYGRGLSTTTRAEESLDAILEVGALVECQCRHPLWGWPLGHARNADESGGEFGPGFDAWPCGFIICRFLGRGRPFGLQLVAGPEQQQGIRQISHRGAHQIVAPAHVRGFVPWAGTR